MLPNLNLTVKYTNGGESTVAVRPRTQIAFERKFDLAISDAFTGDGGFRFEHIYFLAWHAAKTTAEFDDWIDTVDGIDMEVDGSTDPTPPTPSDGS